MPQRIKCRRCGVCAKTTRGISITAGEMTAIKGKAPLVIMNRGGKLAKIPVDDKGNCAALEKAGKITRCKIYRVRPEICRRYPLVFFNGRAIIQSDCTAARELLANGRRILTRAEIEASPFLSKSLKALEKGFPEVKKQKEFEITNA